MTPLSQDLIQKGWSGDRKYRVTDENGTPYLLRISPAERYEHRRASFDYMTRLAALDIPMCRPISCELCEDGVHILQSWIDGEDAEAVMSSLPADEQYAYGLDSGRILRRMHEIPASADAEPWSERYGRKIDRKLAMYAECPLRYDNGQAFIDHITRTRHLIADRPQVYQHGDYHIGNMMVGSDRRLYIIDFEKADWGDPWEEFNRIVWCAQAAPAFASGMVDGYFGVPKGGEIPLAFWELLALYIATNTLSSLPWAIPFGEKEINTMTRQAAEVLGWYDGMTKAVPNWYHRS